MHGPYTGLMNYRHAFHAGNFADVHKHVVLTALLQRLTAKPAPLLYLDTHAGRGLYDLKSIEAARGREWQQGVERLREASLKNPLLRRYRELVAASLDGSQYPGSPLLALQLLRPDDRAVLVEKQCEEARVLRNHLTRTRHVSVLAEDGYVALKAQLPPKEKRGLVLIDPPYEDAQEFQQLERAVNAIPMKRMAHPDEIGELVLFMCSDACHFMTADTVYVSGGGGYR